MSEDEKAGYYHHRSAVAAFENNLADNLSRNQDLPKIALQVPSDDKERFQP
jgi:hypothetical protein